MGNVGSFVESSSVLAEQPITADSSNIKFSEGYREFTNNEPPEECPMHKSATKVIKYFFNVLLYSKI